MITTKMHGYMDYLMGFILIVSPLLFRLPDGAATAILLVLGIGTIMYSVMTNYELGLIKVIPLKVHLGIDVVAGMFLIASPWLFGFADQGYLLFVILGIIEVGAGLMTTNKSHYPEPRENV